MKHSTSKQIFAVSPISSAALIVIGNEVLSGAIRDANTALLGRALSQRGAALAEVRTISDSKQQIIKAIKELSPAYDIVFTSGGIGPTHDDITTDSVSEALGLECTTNQQARQVIEEYHHKRGSTKNLKAALKMAILPEGATLIQNAISAAPGFAVSNVFVLAGVPSIFEAMLQEVIPSLPIHDGRPIISRDIPALSTESSFAIQLGEIQAAFNDVEIGSYPPTEKGTQGKITLRSRDEGSLSKCQQAIEEVFASLQASKS